MQDGSQALLAFVIWLYHLTSGSRGILVVRELIRSLVSSRMPLALCVGSFVFFTVLVSYCAEPGYAGLAGKSGAVSEQYLQSQLYYAYKARLDNQAAQQTQNNQPAPAPTPPPTSPGAPPT